MKYGIVGLTLFVLAWSDDARASCQDGTTASCDLGNGCPGLKDCIDGRWGGCEPMGGTRSCTVCGQSGTQQCDVDGQGLGQCTAPEQCNSCDDNGDGLIDEGLQGCNGIACGTTFEVCGDGLDNDCDGATDEGCAAFTATPTAIPWTFNSLNEMRQDTANSDLFGTTYGKFMNSTWRFIPSHRMTGWALRFDRFALEPCCDQFGIDGVDYTGSPALPFTSTLRSVIPGTPSAMSFRSDLSIQRVGVRTSALVATSGSGGGNKLYSLGLNQGADGVLLYKDDNAYVKFFLPANREVFISIDTDFSATAVDFDLYANWDSWDDPNGLFPTGAIHPDTLAVAQDTDPTGEVLHLGPEASDRFVKVNIRSYSGAGRYRLFLASPKFARSWATEIAFDGDVANGSALDLRGKSIWGQAERHMLGATDGQYRIRPDTEVGRDITCFSCYDLIFSEDNSWRGCSGAVTFDTGTVFAHVEIMKPVWTGAVTWTVDGAACGAPFSISSVGEIAVHEWGHMEFSMDDEYDVDQPSAPVDRCGFTLMSGPGGQSYVTGDRHLEFCTDGLHAKDPTLAGSFTTTAASGSSGWSAIKGHYSDAVEPTGTGDFSRLDRLGVLMESRSFVSFTEN